MRILSLDKSHIKILFLILFKPVLDPYIVHLNKIEHCVCNKNLQHYKSIIVNGPHKMEMSWFITINFINNQCIPRHQLFCWNE